MEAANVQATNLILEISECELYEIKAEEQRLLQKGSLQLHEMQEKKLFFLVLNDFRYSLAKEISVMAADEQINQRLYVFPNIGSFYGIRLAAESNKKAVEMFEQILKEEANLIWSEEVAVTPRMNDVDQQHEKCNSSSETGKMTQQELALKEDNTKKVSEYLHVIGDKAKEGLITTGKIGGSLFGMFGKFLITKIKPNEEEKVIPDETKQKFHQANKCSKIAFKFTKSQLDNMLLVCKNIGKEGIKILEKTETGKNILAEDKYKGAKEIGKASAHAFGAVFDGMREALCTLGGSASSAITEVVAHKYGQDAEDVTKEGLQAVGNIGIVISPSKSEESK